MNSNVIKPLLFFFFITDKYEKSHLELVSEAAFLVSKLNDPMAVICPKEIALKYKLNIMEENVQDNIKKLKHYGYEVLVPDSGYLACGDVGAGKMPSEQTLLEYILKEVAYEKINRNYSRVTYASCFLWRANAGRHYRNAYR